MTLMMICLYIATIIVYIALLNYNKGTNPTLVNMRNCPIHVQLLTHDTILQKTTLLKLCGLQIKLFFINAYNAETLK